MRTWLSFLAQTRINHAKVDGSWSNDLVRSTDDGQLQAVKELEAVLVKYLKDGKIGKKRPTKRLGGFMCFGGQTVDAIDYYACVVSSCLLRPRIGLTTLPLSHSAKLSRTERDVEDYRDQIDTRKPENYGFASMAAVAYAHIVANMLRGKHPKGVTITLAPNPKDIVSLSFAATLARTR